MADSGEEGMVRSCLEASLRGSALLTNLHRLAGRYLNAPWDMEELMAKKDEIVDKDLLKLKLQV